MNCRTFGGTIEKYPLAWIEIDPVFLQGKVVAAVIKNPCAKLILGNIENVKETTDEDVQKWITEDVIKYENAITRNQTKKAYK